MLPRDIVKHDSGAHAVFTEQGSSAFPDHITSAKVLDVIARLPDCDGPAADAVSAYTQVKLEDAPRLLKFQHHNVQIFGYGFHDTNGQNHWKN